MPVVDGLSHWVPTPGDAPPLRDLTVGALLDESVEKWPDHEALVYSAYADLGISVRWTFAELRERALQIAAALVGSGVEHGDRVAIWATNRPEWLEVQLGAAYIGAVLVPMNPLYRADEVRFVLGKTGASVVFAEPANRQTDLWAILEEAAEGLDDLHLKVALGDGDTPFAEWRHTHGDPDVVARRRKAVTSSDISQVQFTSGTTGFPKGAELRHGSLTDNARLFADVAQLHLGGKHCNPMPFFHCGGCVMATLGTISSGSAHLPTLTFDARRMVDTIDTERATSAGAVPTMLIGLDEEVQRAGGDITSLDVVVTGGSPVPVDVERRWIERYGVRFCISYGMTEASPVITLSDPEDPEHLQIATCGKPIAHVEVDVVDVATRERVPIGEQGELRTRGFLVMNGYWDEPEATANAIEDGWLRTGDLAQMDADGYVSITGRAKDMIIRGGENISPVEIEDALRRLDGVLDASVIGVPDERYGEQVAAFVRLDDGVTLTAQEVKEQLTGRLARYKIPSFVEAVDAWPTTPSGKVQKFKLREQFLAARAPGPAAA